MKPALVFAILLSVTLAPASERPNIIVVMVDDMGFSDIGPYGSEIPTPHLDRLTKDGARFSQFYNTGRCCPTRASLLTGLYSHQAGIGWMTADQKLPGYRGRLSKHCVTIAEVLGTARIPNLHHRQVARRLRRRNQPAEARLPPLAQPRHGRRALLEPDRQDGDP